MYVESSYKKSKHFIIYQVFYFDNEIELVRKTTDEHLITKIFITQIQPTSYDDIEYGLFVNNVEVFRIKNELLKQDNDILEFCDIFVPKKANIKLKKFGNNSENKSFIIKIELN